MQNTSDAKRTWQGITAAWRTPPWLPSGWECRDQRLSLVRGNLCRRRVLGRGRRRHPLLGKFWLAARQPVPRPDAPALRSSNSIRCRCDPESSETRPPQRCLVRLPSMLLRAQMSDKGRKYSQRIEPAPVPAVTSRLAERSRLQRNSFFSVPLARESQAAKATPSACPEGSAYLSPRPGILLASCRLPWPRQVRLHFQRPGSRLAPKPLPPTAELLLHCRKRLLAEQRWPAKSPHFPCCPPG